MRRDTLDLNRGYIKMHLLNSTFLTTIMQYKKLYLKYDLASAATVAVISVPQSMAYALIAGINPIYGLYTAIMGSIFGAMFGSSKHLVTGPTNAIALMIASVLTQFAGQPNHLSILFLLTFMVGIIRIILGLLNASKLITYVSHPVVVGYTGGVGLLITIGQLTSFLGLAKGEANNSVSKLYFIITHLSQTNLYALGIGIFTIVFIIICKKINENIPGSLLGIILSTVVVMIFSLDNYGVKLAPEVPRALPSFQMVKFDFNIAQQIFGGAFAIAVVGLIEAISISKSISTQSRQALNMKKEIIGQGLSNTFASFFQCMPGSGSFTRSAINYYSGAKTGISSAFSAAFISLIVVALAPQAKYIPMASLGGLIIVIAYNMVNKREIARIMRTNKTDAILLWITMFLTVLIPRVDIALFMGVCISIGTYLWITSTVHLQILMPSGQPGVTRLIEMEPKEISDQRDTLIINIEGNLYFGCANELEHKLNGLIGKSKIYIIRMRRVDSCDFTALEVLRNFVINVGKRVIICGIDKKMQSQLNTINITKMIGEDNVILAKDQLFASNLKAQTRAQSLTYKMENTGP